MRSFDYGNYREDVILDNPRNVKEPRLPSLDIWAKSANAT